MKRNLAKKRIFPLIIGLIISILIIVGCVFIVSQIDNLFDNLTEDVKSNLYYAAFFIIFLFGVISLILLNNLLKSRVVISYDDNYLYIIKTTKKTVQVPYKEIKRIKSKIVNKKNKSKHGNIIIKTKKKKYKIKNVIKVQEVETQLKFLIKNQK
ncbi:MAG: hypothetical protein PHD47_02985 [Acholeplasmataceae bacterium]|nr:hypothetical protein [Acholeplasmataceae bacterium]